MGAGRSAPLPTLIDQAAPQRKYPLRESFIALRALLDRALRVVELRPLLGLAQKPSR
jgi:hypothetical protein